MRELIAGDGGTVLIEAGRCLDAVALACEGIAAEVSTPSGVPVYPPEQLPTALEIDRVRLLRCEPSTATTVRTWATSRGLPIAEDTHPVLDRPSGARIVAVHAPSTGSGKTPLVRRVARTLLRSGVHVVVLRHPIANLLHWQRFDPVVVRSPQELFAPRPLEEREELAPVVGAGIPVVSGLDAERALAIAVREAGPDGVIVWDGGGCALPWIVPDVHIVAVDLLRALSDAQLRDHISVADAIVLTKADSAPADAARQLETRMRGANPEASVTLADLAVGVQPVNALADRRAVLVEDANSLVLGRLAAGAASVAARRFRCGAVDPRPFAVGAIARALQDHPHIGAVIPSLGRTQAELDDLAASVASTPGDVILWASNADPATVIADERRPIIRAFGELTEVAGPSLQEVLSPLVPGHG
jgi:predicted GTPase